MKSSAAKNTSPFSKRKYDGEAPQVTKRMYGKKAGFMRSPSSSHREPSRNPIPSRKVPPRLKFANFDVSRFDVMQKLFMGQVKEFRSTLKKSNPEITRKLHSWGINSQAELLDLMNKFETVVKDCCAVAQQFASDKTKDENAKQISESDPSLLMYRSLQTAFVEKEFRGLYQEVQYAFLKFVIDKRFSQADIDNQNKLADLRYPAEWYPATRVVQRHIHLHVGPTNSGKTYQALKRLEEAKTGVYAGPLRLLAHEVYTRLNAKNIPCALITGEERRVPPDAEHHMSSCTVEMVPLNAELDVAVIDEIQMIGNPERGWAWTQALLGVKAKEVHLCGELRTIPIIEQICASIGDKLTIHRYERLSPLETMKSSLRGDLSNLRKGDCVILFSRVGIHAMKAEIEKATKKRCAVVYGSLPPETRAQQAALFNDQDNDYDFLVASDAVGMGLNLSIKRIIFESTSKYNGYTVRSCTTSEIKQIGGRAGRFKTATQATLSSQNTGNPGVDVTDGAVSSQPKGEKSLGLVTTLEAVDLPIVSAAMAGEAEPIDSAGIFPPNTVLQRFAAYFPSGTPFSYILLRLQEVSSVHSRYHLCSLKEQVAVADAIQEYDLTIVDRITFCAAPVTLSDPVVLELTAAFARCIAENRGGELLEIPGLDLEILEQETRGMTSLRQLESLHKGITLYLWLSYRFAGVFTSQALAFHVKSLVEVKIDEALSEFKGLDRKARRAQNQARRAQLVKDEVALLALTENSNE